MAVAGDIAAQAKGLIPRTWNALESSPGYGDSFLQQHRRNVVYKLLGVTELNPDTTEELLDQLVKEYAGKMLALSLCTPGIDYWLEQPINVSAGERSNKGFINRAGELRELRKILIEETRMMWPDVQPLLPIRKVSRSGAPRVEQAGSGHITTDPEMFEGPYAEPTEAPL